MEKLEELIEKLNTDHYSAVSVFDLDTNLFVCRNKTHAQIISEHQSAEEFFEALFAKGHKRLNLSLKRKNGSTFKVDGSPFDVNFSSPAQEEKKIIDLPIQTIQAEPVKTFENSFGLGQLDMVNLFVAKGDAQRLHSENQVLKSENLELKRKNDEQREEILGMKYSREGSKGTQEMLLGAIQNLPLIMSAVKGNPVPPMGLASPVESNLTPIKQAFANELQNIDDMVVNVLHTINGALDTNEQFSNELAQLLQKYKLWEA